jgi:hypothetical protein
VNAHPAKLVDVDGEAVLVDFGIIPVVRWANGLPGVRTLFSCQGDSSDLGQQPYVMFRCDSQAALWSVLSRVRQFSQDTYLDDEGQVRAVLTESVGVEVSYYTECPRYTVRFADPAQLARFVAFLGVGC